MQWKNGQSWSELGRGPAELARTQLGAAFEGSRGMAWGGHRFSLIIPAISLPAGANTAWQGILPKPGDPCGWNRYGVYHNSFLTPQTLLPVRV